MCIFSGRSEVVWCVVFLRIVMGSLPCVQEVPGRDDHVWNGMVCWVHGCMVWVVLCVVRCGVIVVGVSCASWICVLSGRCQV